ncbi:MAG TPA: fumarylacetoacetate hydrolase family protein [Alphaproteobacteria bacterium]|jgi:2-keto-4-pentenoate hydratase/2-oxohepta-3-ene-1,7-dioic acid hydratase in catechol pathway|nr:fumarylacetoacetate hydrolase family protein [Alphaproteobacteria bacterium]
MRLCRYDDNRLGVVRDGQIFDVTAALDQLPALRWPLPPGDLLIANLAKLKPEIERLARGNRSKSVTEVKFLSPVANPSKIVAAPVNYQKHIDESRLDKGISFGQDIKTIDFYGVFLKSSSALVGAGEGVALRFTDRRNDHEVELGVVIGKTANNVPRAKAMDYVAGYSIALDMTVRGTEDRSLRKSLDTYAVLGPWLVTPDEIPNPGNLEFSIKVNDELRQHANTRDLIFDIAKLIEYSSSFYTLHPGDIIMTGTPEGVGPVKAGDVMHVEFEGIGKMDVAVRNA